MVSTWAYLSWPGAGSGFLHSVVPPTFTSVLKAYLFTFQAGQEELKIRHQQAERCQRVMSIITASPLQESNWSYKNLNGRKRWPWFGHFGRKWCFVILFLFYLLVCGKFWATTLDGPRTSRQHSYGKLLRPWPASWAELRWSPSCTGWKM